MPTLHDFFTYCYFGMGGILAIAVAIYCCLEDLVTDPISRLFLILVTLTAWPVWILLFILDSEASKFDQ